MWTRKELKEKAKAALKRNYWKAVLVSVIIIILGGGIDGGFAASSSGTSGVGQVEEIEIPNNESNVIVMRNEGTLSDTADSINSAFDALDAAITNTLEELDNADVAVLCVLMIVFIIVFIIVLAIVFAVDILLINPLEIGAQRFMLKSVDDKGNVAELGYTFDHSYKNGIKTAFFRDLYTLLWALLFIIPGIYKKYQYYMVSYILAENPDMPYKEVLERSKKMMDGQKWKTFVLDLSFILWHMLGIVTCGLTEIFYVRPYKYLTRAALYRTLCERQQEEIVEVEVK